MKSMKLLLFLMIISATIRLKPSPTTTFELTFYFILCIKLFVNYSMHLLLCIYIVGVLKYELYAINSSIYILIYLFNTIYLQRRIFISMYIKASLFGMKLDLQLILTFIHVLKMIWPKTHQKM